MRFLARTILFVFGLILAIPAGFITVWVLRGMAKFHASLAVELLGRR